MARKAEELGFDSIWFAEHPILPVHSDTPFPRDDGRIPETYRHFTDPYIALARASAVTTKIKLGTGITLVPERNPLVLAKQIAALDHYSGGRFLFGIGAGWNREETTMMGGDFDHRWTQTREAVLAMKELWTKGRSRVSRPLLRFPPRILLSQAGPEASPAGDSRRPRAKRAATHYQVGRRMASQQGQPAFGGRQPKTTRRHGCRAGARPFLYLNIGIRPASRPRSDSVLHGRRRKPGPGIPRSLRH